jgi:5-methylcytosine-specific restriction protein A
MPTSPLRLCRRPGCPALVSRGYCAAHKPAERSDQAKVWHKMYGARWQKYRLVFLAEHPLCVDPYKEHGKRPVVATVIDHIRAHRGDYGLFWLGSNHRSLCASCHSTLTAEFDGGFGRAPLPGKI